MVRTEYVVIINYRTLGEKGTLSAKTTYDAGWRCDSIDKYPFKSCLPSLRIWSKDLYMLESVYNGLSSENQAISRSRVHGLLRGSGAVYPSESTIVKCFTDNCRALIPADPCKDVSCPDKCVGVDKYDQVCQDGICVRGTLIQTNSEQCGYTPEPTPDPTPTPSSDAYIIVALMLAGTYIILSR